jgi:exosortase
VENITSSISESEGADAPLRKQGWCELGVHNYIRMLIIAALFYYLFHNEIESIVHRWLTDSSWSHGFLIPLFSLYFINQHKSEILNLRIRPSYLGLFFLICGILFYPFNIILLRYGYFRPLGMIVTLGAIVLFLGGWRLVKYTWLPVAFLVFAVPLPQRYYVSITMPMRLFAAKVATFLLNLVSEMEATVSGVVIDVIYKGQRMEPALNVAEACSGMRLLMAFLGFIYIFIHPRYAQGIYHDILGLAMLPLAFGLYGFLAWFMSSLFIEETKAVTEDVVVRKR